MGKKGPSPVSYKKEAEPEFEFPPLPKWEIRICFAVIIAMFITIWYNVWYLGRFLPASVFHNQFRFQKSRVPIIGGERLRDVVDFEWLCMSLEIPRLVVGLGLSSVLWEVSQRVLPGKEDGQKVLVVLGTIATLLWLCIPWEIGVILLQAGSIFLLSKAVPYQLVVWAGVTGLLFYNIKFSWIDEGTFLSVLFKQYSLFHYVSYCVEEICHQPTPGRSLWGQALDFLHYVFYLPYKGYVIMPYRLFQQRLAGRCLEDRDWTATAVYAIRLVFWYYAAEIICHYCYLKPVVRNFESWPVEYQESMVWILSANFCMGIFFHLKYAVIWGIPNIAIHVDRMRALRPPVCVSRVALYSSIWREFDRGLYLFIKHQVYIPICRPTFAAWRKLLAGTVVFLVILIWHDVKRNILIWTIINALVLGAKGLGILAYKRNTYGVADLCGRLSPTNFRRLLGVAHIPLIIWSLLGMFYFIGGSASGDHAMRMLIVRDWMWVPNLEALGQVLLAYCFAQFCTEVGIWVGEREKREDADLAARRAEKAEKLKQH